MEIESVKVLSVSCSDVVTHWQRNKRTFCYLIESLGRGERERERERQTDRERERERHSAVEGNNSVKKECLGSVTVEWLNATRAV